MVNLLIQIGEALRYGSKEIKSQPISEYSSSVAEEAFWMKFCKCKIPMGLIILFSVSDGFRRMVLLQMYL